MSRISVIIPVYNTEKYLKKSIESVLHQTYEDLEVILVDDGSTDGSSPICDNYARDDARIKVIHKKNEGLSSARNAGIEIATGEYLAFVDSDDYILPNMYERMLLEMKASEADIVMCSYLHVNENDCYLEKANIKEWTGSGAEYLQVDGITCNYVWNKLYHKNLFSDTRFPIGKYFEDIFIMHNIFWKADKVSVIPDVFYVYRQRESGISKDLISYRRVDFIEALVERLGFLLQIEAEESVLSFFVRQIYSAWNRFYQADMMDDQIVSVCWNKCYMRFRLITKGIIRGWNIRNRTEVSLLRIHPQLLRLLNVGVHRIGAIPSFGKRRIKRLRKVVKVNKEFKRIQNTEDGLSKNINQVECLKYRAALNNDGQNLILSRVKAFVMNDIVLINDQFTLSDDPCVPTVVFIVKNELERMNVFYDHYHKLGVHQFVALDNNSDDGTLEFLLEQSDTRVYQTCSEFQTQKKEGWIEKILAMTGYNRWYIVVDSDELLDYIGSERHSAESLIRKVHNTGIKRIGGYMLDMYAKDSLFSESCKADRILDHYRYFDKEGYYTKGDIATSNEYVFGGPRFREFGMILALGKQAVFYFDEQTLYRDCHSLFPVVPASERPTLFVLRHYKFLNKDYEEYQRRIREKNFYGSSIEYRTIMEQLQKNGEQSLYYYDSCEYVNSDSLRCLPYLEEVNW